MANARTDTQGVSTCYLSKTYVNLLSIKAVCIVCGLFVDNGRAAESVAGP